MLTQDVIDRLVSHFPSGKTYIGQPFDASFIDTNVLEAAFKCSIPENPNPLEIIGLLLLDGYTRNHLGMPCLSDSDVSRIGIDTQRTITSEMHHIETSIDHGKYDEALQLIADAESRYGQFPALDGFRAEIEMFNFLAQEFFDEKKGNKL